MRGEFEYRQNSVKAVFEQLGLSVFVHEHQNRKNNIEKLPVIRKLSIDFLMAKLQLLAPEWSARNFWEKPWTLVFRQICFKKWKAVSWDPNRRYPAVSSGGKWNWTKRKIKTDWSIWHIFCLTDYNASIQLDDINDQRTSLLVENLMAEI